MSRSTVVRYHTTLETADKNQRLVEQVYPELAAERPEALRYMTFRPADGVTFLHAAAQEDGVDVLPSRSAFVEFQRGLVGRAEAAPDPSSAQAPPGGRAVGRNDFKDGVHMANTAKIRYTTKPEAADENQRAVEQVFAELAEKMPDGLSATLMTCHSFDVEDIDGR